VCVLLLLVVNTRWRLPTHDYVFSVAAVSCCRKCYFLAFVMTRIVLQTLPCQKGSSSPVLLLLGWSTFDTTDSKCVNRLQ